MTEETYNTIHTQVGGNHYSKMAITPLEYIHANRLDFCQGNVVKYISRHKDKNKDEDVKKCIDYCIKILCLDYGYTSERIHELLEELW